MDNDTASIGTNNDKCALLNVGDNKSEEDDGINNPPSNDDDDALHHHQQQNPLHLFTSSEFDLSSAHRSCPDLSLSLSLESFIRTFERERATSASLKPGGDGNAAARIPGASGVPLSTIATNLLLPTPKTGTSPVDIALMNRICKSMSNIDGLGAARAKKKVNFQHGTKQPEIVEPTEEDFFEMIERLNANRLQDQRAEFPSAAGDEEGGEQGGKLLGANADALLAMIAEMQSRRYDDQRASPVLSDYETKEILRRLSLRAPNERIDKKVVDEQLYDLIMSYQGSRLEDQRSELGGRKLLENGSSNSNSKSAQKNSGGQLLAKKDSKKKKAFCKSNSSTMK